MRIVTVRSLIQGLPEKWKKAYYVEHMDTWQFVFTPSGMSRADAPYERLLALDLDTASREEIEAVLGRDWIWTQCECCSRDTGTAAVLETKDGEEMLRICIECLNEAGSALEHVLTQDER